MFKAVPTGDITALAASNRAKRLNKEPNNWLLGMGMDLLFGALPWYDIACSESNLKTASFTFPL